MNISKPMYFEHKKNIILSSRTYIYNKSLWMTMSKSIPNVSDNLTNIQNTCIIVMPIFEIHYPWLLDTTLHMFGMPLGASKMENYINSCALPTRSPPPSFGEFHWERWEPFANLQNPTQMLSYNQMNNQPLHLADIDFSSAKILSIISFFRVAWEVS
jgi:hypothetical protein